MKHILCVHLLNWPIDRLARRLRLRPPDPQRHEGRETVAATTPLRGKEGQGITAPQLLIVHAVANRQTVVAADAAALRLGIRPGQTLTEARIRSTNLLIHPWQPGDDVRGLESLGRYLMRFTPVVATTTCDATDLFSEPSSPMDPAVTPSSRLGGALSAAVLYLDLTGCEQLFGGLDDLLGTIARALAGLRIFARLAVAPNPAAAYALTFSVGPSIPVIEAASLREILAPLPIDCLRLDDRTLHLLHQLGIETMGQLLKLPRNQLASRFGRGILQRIGQTLGEIAEPLVPLPCHRPIEGRMDFEGAVGQPEAMEEAFRRVLPAMIEECYRRGQGFRELRITLPRPDEPPLSFTLQLSGPTRNPRLLLNLFRCAMEQQQRKTGRSAVPHSARGRDVPSPRQLAATPGGSLRYIAQPNFDAAFLGLQLSATRLDTLVQQQANMVEADGQAGLEQWQETLDRLRIRFGQESIVQAQLVESHLPEHAFKLTPAVADPGVPPCLSVSVVSPHRPLTLVPTPQEIRVTVSPSDDRDGRPIQFGDEDGFHRVVHWVGPERISGEWWEGRNKTRDYFDVEDETGRRHWIFRVHETGRWFLHGLFC